MMEYSSTIAPDPLSELLAGRVQCVEFVGSRVVVDAPRPRRVYLSGSFNPIHEGECETHALSAVVSVDCVSLSVPLLAVTSC